MYRKAFVSIVLGTLISGCATEPQEQTISEATVRNFVVPKSDYSVEGLIDSASIVAAFESSMYQASRAGRATASYYQNIVPLYTGVEIDADNQSNLSVFYFENRGVKKRYKTGTFKVTTVVDGENIKIQVACPTSISEVNQLPINIPWNSQWPENFVKFDLGKMCAALNIPVLNKKAEDDAIAARIQQAAAQREAARKQESEARQAALAGASTWRKHLTLGSDTHCGMVVEMKPPLAKVQTMIGEIWFRSEQLWPPGSKDCHFVNGVYQEME